jgi:uncharacterized protein involved in exopolysaccharide biosynthesis
MEENINLLEYLQIVYRRKWIVVGLALAFVFTSLVYSLNQPKLYRATGTIMLADGGGGGLASALGVASFLGGTAASGGEAKLSAILSSATLAKQVAQNLKPREYFPRLAQGPALSEKELLEAADILRGSIKSASMDSLMHISVVWTDPEKAAYLANLYVKQLGLFLNERALNVNFQTIDPAIAPESRFSPKIRVNVMFGGILGLFSGISLAFFLEFLRFLKKKS